MPNSRHQARRTGLPRASAQEHEVGPLTLRQKGPGGPFARLHHSDFFQKTKTHLSFWDRSLIALWVGSITVPHHD
jgi:hypothetical protein